MFPIIINETSVISSLNLKNLILDTNKTPVNSGFAFDKGILADLSPVSGFFLILPRKYYIL